MAVEGGYERRSHRFSDKTDDIDHNPLQRDSSEEVALLHEEQEQQEGLDDHGDEPELDQGFGLGFLGLAALTLPSQDMVVPPLNYAMVRMSEMLPLSVVPILPRKSALYLGRLACPSRILSILSIPTAGCSAISFAFVLLQSGVLGRLRRLPSIDLDIL